MNSYMNIYVYVVYYLWITGIVEFSIVRDIGMIPGWYERVYVLAVIVNT